MEASGSVKLRENEPDERSLVGEEGVGLLVLLRTSALKFGPAEAAFTSTTAYVRWVQLRAVPCGVAADGRVRCHPAMDETMASAMWLAILAPPMVGSALILAIAVAAAQRCDDLPRWLRGANAYALIAVAFAALTALFCRLMYPQFWK
jgi:hypothetical protein